jgi:hypothetical protein
VGQEPHLRSQKEENCDRQGRLHDPCKTAPKVIPNEWLLRTKTSGASSFTDKSGWPHGTIYDTDPVLDLVKGVEAPWPTRQVEESVLEYAKECHVAAFVVAAPIVCESIADVVALSA